jgi:Predicted xylanase/chitin deacetylase
MEKPKIILQIDCDSEIALSAHYSYTSYAFGYEVYYNALNVFQSLLSQYNLKATFFVVGKDLENKEKCDKLKNLILYGHEVANHTYSHPNCLSKMLSSEIREEIEKTNQICLEKLGVAPKGFRAPNFDISLNVLNVLDDMGFYYDCSILFSPWKPILKLFKGYNPFKAGYLGKNNLFFSRKYPYNPKINKQGTNFCKGTIIEIPITTFPYIKFPCNFSYLLAMPKSLGYGVFRKLFRWHQKKNNPLVFIFHLADLIDNQYLFKTEAKYYKSLEERLFFIGDIFKTIADDFESITTYEYLKSLQGDKL